MQLIKSPYFEKTKRARIGQHNTIPLNEQTLITQPSPPLENSQLYYSQYINEYLTTGDIKHVDVPQRIPETAIHIQPAHFNRHNVQTIHTPLTVERIAPVHFNSHNIH